MAQDALLKVVDAEKRATAIVVQANADAKRIVEEAKIRAKEITDMAADAANAKVNELLAEAENKSNRTARDIDERAKNDCQALRVLAGGKMAKASAFIVEKVVNG